jgi:hypothetical protein
MRQILLDAELMKVWADTALTLVKSNYDYINKAIWRQVRHLIY